MQKKVVEETPFIDIETFKGFKGGETLYLKFSFSEKRVGKVSFFEDYFTIHFVASGNYQHIQIETTPVGFGERPWLICPLCGRRCKRLYFVNFTFRCRQCQGLVYRSSKLSGNELDEFSWKIRRLQQRLGMDISAPVFSADFVGIDDLPTSRPKHMKRETYDRLRLELWVLQEQRARAWAKMAATVYEKGGWFT